MTRGADLQAVSREGKRIRTAHLDARVHASPLAHPRIGFIVPRHGQTAVLRNRLKRRLRELARTELLPHLAPVDVVIKARREGYDADFATLRDEVGSVRRRAEKLRES